MQDDFLKAFNDRRRLTASQDRTFTIGDVELTYRVAIPPEVGFAYEAMNDANLRWALALDHYERNGTGGEPPESPMTNEEMMAVYDATIKACLEDESHAKWDALRSPDAPHPLTSQDILSLAVWLLGKVNGLPTDGLLGSSSTQPETATTSTGNSPSPAPARTRSEPSSPLPTPS